MSDLTSRFGLIVLENFNKNVREKYISSLVDNLENYFSDSAVLGALETLFNSKKASSASIEGYGNVAIDKIDAQYPMTAVKQDLQHEWLAFKHILIDVFAEASTSEVMTIISSDTSYSSLYPTLSKLAGITLTLPVSTAHVERGFSSMKRIKTDLRNGLKTEKLDKLIRLSTEEPS